MTNHRTAIRSIIVGALLAGLVVLPALALHVRDGIGTASAEGRETATAVAALSTTSAAAPACHLLAAGEDAIAAWYQDHDVRAYLADGQWIGPKGTAIGYSLAETSNIWNTAACANARPMFG